MVSGEIRVGRETDEPEWEVVLGERYILALAPADVAGAAPAAFRTPVGRLEELIARIPLGEAGVDRFALVWWPIDGGRVTAVVRGDAALELRTAGGLRRHDARGIRPWHLAEFDEVVGVRLGRAVAEHEPWQGATEPGGAHSRRVTSIEWRSDAAAPPTEPIATAAHAADGDPAEEAPEEIATAQAMPPAAWFRVSGGVPRDVQGVVLIGRRPAPPRIASEPVELVRVDPTALAVSSTHLELRRAGGRLVATDLRSTNGTIVRTSSGRRRMRAGESIVVAIGSVLELGGDTIVEILAPPKDQAHPDRQVPA